MSQIDHLRQRVVALPHGRTKELGELIDGWTQQVERLASEALDRDTKADAWGVHDYIGALHLRDLVANVVAKFESDEAVAVETALRAADSNLRSFTEPDAGGLIVTVAAGDHGSGWWWKRIPVRGPVRREAAQIAATS
jgi:hypothetical protein